MSSSSPTLNSIRRHATYSMLSCDGDRPVQYLAQVWGPSHNITFQILLSNLWYAKPIFTCQLKQLRSNYLQKKKRKEAESSRVRCVINTIIGWPTPIYQSFSQYKKSSPTITPPTKSVPVACGTINRCVTPSAASKRVWVLCWDCLWAIGFISTYRSVHQFFTKP